MANISIRQRVIDRYPNCTDSWEMMLLVLYRKFGTYIKVGEHLHASESGVFRAIQKIEAKQLEVGNGFPS